MEKLFLVEDIAKLYSAFIKLCNYVEEDVCCGNCPLYEEICGASDEAAAKEFGEALARIRFVAGIPKGQC